MMGSDHDHITTHLDPRHMVYYSVIHLGSQRVELLS